MGVAEALDYLHNNGAQSVIHREVKSSNVLLSEDFEPQVTHLSLDFYILLIHLHLSILNLFCFNL